MRSAAVLLPIIVATAVVLVFSGIAIAGENNFWVKCDISDSSHIGQCHPSKGASEVCYKNQWVSVDDAKKYCCWSWSKDKSSSEPKWTDKCDVSASISVDKTTGKSSDPFVFTLTANPYPSESNGYQAELQYAVSGESTWKTCGVKTVVDSTPWSVAVRPSTYIVCPDIKILATNGNYLFDFKVLITEPNADGGKSTNKVTLMLDDIVPATSSVCTTDFSDYGASAYDQCYTGWYKKHVKVKLSCNDGVGVGCDKIYYCNDKQDCVPSQYSDARYGAEVSFYADGINYLNYYSTDKVSNVENSKPMQIKIDTKTPTISVTGAPSDWINQDRQAVVSCTDTTPGSGCDANSYGLIIYDYDKKPGTCPENYLSYTLASTQTISDHEWVCAAGKDVVGWESFSTPTEFKVDVPKPSVPIMNDPGLYSKSGNVYWIWSPANDNLGGSGVKQYTIQVSKPGSSDFSSRDQYDTSFIYYYSAGLSEGKIYSRVRAVDNAGNVGDWSSAVSTIVDKTPPLAGTYTINGKSSGTVYTKGQLTHAWSGFRDDASKANDFSWLYSFEIWRAPYNVNNCNKGNTAGCEWPEKSDNSDTKTPDSGSWAETISASYMYGWHSSDNAGNYITESIAIPKQYLIEVIYDITTPVTSILCNDAECSGNWYKVPVTFALSCADTGGSGCDNIYYSLDGSSFVVYNPSSKPSVSADEKHSIDYYSVDKAGNTEASKNKKINIDKTLPVTSAQCSTNNVNYVDCSGGWYTSNVHVKLSCADATSGCQTTKYCTGSGCTPSTAYSSPIQLATQGTTTIRFNSADAAGNTEDVKEKTIYIDPTPPTTSFSPSGSLGWGGWYISDVSITLRCTDAGGSGCKQIQYCIGSGTCAQNTIYGSAFPITAEGTIPVRYFSEDNAGNTEGVKYNLVEIDKTVPSLSVSYAPQAISVVDEVTLTATASDATSGLSSVTISVDGAVKKTCNYNGETSAQICAYTIPAFGPAGAGRHTFSSTAADKAGNTVKSGESGVAGGSDGGFTVEPCNFGPVSITPMCGSGYSPNCEPGEKVQVTATYSGNCPSTAYIQVDAHADKSGTCDIIDQGRSQCDTSKNKITGINVQCAKSVCTGEWVIPETERTFPDNCKGKTVNAGDSSIRDNYPCAGGKGYNSATATGSMKFWSENECNNPGVCDYPFEKQTNCPNDCRTTVSTDPYNTYPGSEAGLTIQFEDGRYDAGRDVSFEILINPGPGQIVWDKSNGCFSGERFPVIAAGGNVTQNGRAKIITKCRMPAGIAVGINTLQATPTFY